MGSYQIDNATAVQGRYATVVTPQQPATQPAEQTTKTSAMDTITAANEKEVIKKEAQQNKNLSAEEKKVIGDVAGDEEQMHTITEIMNKFVAQWNADLRFSVHKDTSLLTVKFVDVKSDKVLKEFPSEEYLTMISNIRKYIGALVDEKV